jgi:hypothetical protein
MSEQETMKLVAELLDKTSGPLKDIQKSLKETSDIAKRLHGEGKAQVSDHDKSYQSLVKSLKSTRGEIAGAFTPAMAELGLTTFSVGGALAALVANLKSFASQYSAMRDATRRTGASPDFLEATANVIERLTGEEPGQAIQNLAAMKEHLDRLTRLRPDELNKWNDAYTGLYESLGKKLVGKTLPQQIEETLSWFDSHPDIQVDKKRDILSLMGMDPALATVKLSEFREAVDKEFAYQKSHPFNMELAKKLNGSFAELRETIRGVGWELQETFGGPGTKAIESIAGIIHSEVGDIEAIGRALVAVNEVLAEIGGKGDILGQAATKMGAHGLLDKYPWLKSFSDQELLKLLPHGGAGGDGFKDRWDGLFHPSAFVTGGGAETSQAETMFSDAVKGGMLAAFREWFSSVQSSKGYQNAAYSPSNQGTGPGQPRFGSNDFPNLEDGPADQGRSSGSRPYEMPESVKGAVRALKPGNRSDNAQRIYDELRRLGHSHEQASAALGHAQAESGFNPDATGDHGTAHGFFQMRGSRWATAMRDAAKAGTTPFSPEAAARHFDRELHHEESRAGRAYFNAQSTRDAVTALNGYERFAGYQHGQAARYMAAERFARSMKPRDLLETARAAGAMGGATQKVEGDASLKIDLNGFPRGTKTDLTYGGLFTQYTLSRGQQMEASEQK